MALFFNSPLLGFCFLMLLLLLFRTNDNKYGRRIGYKIYQKLIKNYPDSVYVIDIRSKKAFEEARLSNSYHKSKALSPLEVDKKGMKLIIIHDSNLELTDYCVKNKIKPYSSNVYQLDFIDLNLAQYESPNYQENEMFLV